MCLPVLVGALSALWADTQVRPYTNHINTTNPAIRRCNPLWGRTARASVPVNGYSVPITCHGCTTTDALPLDTIRAFLQNRYSSRFDFGCSGSLSRQKFCSIKSLLYFCIVNETPK